MFQIIKIQAVLKQEIMVVFKFHSYLYYKELKLLKTFFTRIGLVIPIMLDPHVKVEGGGSKGRPIEIVS